MILDEEALLDTVFLFAYFSRKEVSISRRYHVVPLLAKDG
jgi:hypothetical protein